jgi:hypothetical protein
MYMRGFERATSPGNRRNLRPHRRDDPLQILDLHRQRRHEDNNVAQGAKNDAVFSDSPANGRPFAVTRIERLFGFPIGHQLDADHESFLANVADVPQGGKLLQHPSKAFGLSLHGINEL